MLVGELINAVELLAGAIRDDRPNRLFAAFRLEILVQLNRRLEVMRPAKHVIPDIPPKADERETYQIARLWRPALRPL